MARRWLAQITLGELMVAVAIVGLLVATVLPVFLASPGPAGRRGRLEPPRSAEPARRCRRALMRPRRMYAAPCRRRPPYHPSARVDYR
ncbi:MAG: type II secretion system protein [bacterium]